MVHDNVYQEAFKLAFLSTRQEGVALRPESHLPHHTCTSALWRITRDEDRKAMSEVLADEGTTRKRWLLTFDG